MATRRVEGAERAKETSIRGGADGTFTLDEVKALVKVLEGSDVTSLRWHRNGQKIVIRRGQPVAALAPAMQAPAAALAVAPAAPTAPAPVPAATPKPGSIVTSPFVGTFYLSPSPDSPPYVEVGTVVKKGQALCIVEAMKLMNEIEAEVAGTVAEILAPNATPVEFGQALFRIETS